MAVKVPKLKILWNKRKHKRRDGLGFSSYSVSGDEDMEASYPDSVKDSNEGGLEESEEVREGAGEGGHASILGETPLPKHLGHVPDSLCGVASKQGPTC